MTEERPAPTFIAILDLSLAAADRPAAIRQLESERPRVRSMPGSVAFRVYPSIENDTDIAVLHEWLDEASFRGYLDSDVFERSSAVLRPLATAPPVSRRFHVELIESIV